MKPGPQKKLSLAPGPYPSKKPFFDGAKGQILGLICLSPSLWALSEAGYLSPWALLSGLAASAVPAWIGQSRAPWALPGLDWLLAAALAFLGLSVAPGFTGPLLSSGGMGQDIFLGAAVGLAAGFFALQPGGFGQPAAWAALSGAVLGHICQGGIGLGHPPPGGSLAFPYAALAIPLALWIYLKERPPLWQCGLILGLLALWAWAYAHPGWPWADPGRVSAPLLPLLPLPPFLCFMAFGLAHRPLSPDIPSLSALAFLAAGGLAALGPGLGDFRSLPTTLALASLCGLDLAISRNLRKKARAFLPEARLGKGPGGPIWPASPEGRPLYRAARLCRRDMGNVALWADYPSQGSCLFLKELGGGPFACQEACLGQGDCLRACPYGAISFGKDLNGLPAIDITLCRGCGRCRAACPQGLISLVPENARVLVACGGRERMKAMSRLCQAGCLGCGKCRKACPAGAVGRPGRAAPPPINHHLCLAWGESCRLACMSSCPRKLFRKPFGSP